MVKQIQIVAFMILAFAFATFNVITALNANRPYDLSTTTIAAISGESDGSGEGDGEFTWNCTTLSGGTSVEYASCMLCKDTHIVSVWDTRVCNDGILTWCYPGYVVTYYDCERNVTDVFDNTNMSGCN